jgi:hypothetical protein
MPRTPDPEYAPRVLCKIQDFPACPPDTGRAAHGRRPLAAVDVLPIIVRLRH